MALNITEETFDVLHVSVTSRRGKSDFRQDQAELNWAHGVAILP
jgi:hypothetical protein